MIKRHDDDPPVAHGPSVAAIPLWATSGGKRTQLLSKEERSRLAVIASIVRFKKGEEIYREGDRAEAVFNIISGVVKSCKTMPDKTERIFAFLFADDLVGLAKEGVYVNTTKAVTALTAYRIPVSALESRLRKDAALEFHVICKLCHELRETQRHALLLGRKSALARAAMFLQLLENHQTASRESAHQLHLPMNRSDIAAYLGMSLEALSRTFRALRHRGVISFSGKHYVRVVNHGQLETLAGDGAREEKDDGTDG